MKARKLLDFQNEVEGIASKSPNDLTVMFEDISESTELRESHDAARTEKEAAGVTVRFYWRKRKGGLLSGSTKNRKWKKSLDGPWKLNRYEI